MPRREERYLPQSHPPRWSVYGRRVDKIHATGKISMAGIHQEGFTTERDAVAFAMKNKVLYPSATMVVARLDRNQDKNGERHVVLRINDGRAWWE